MQCSDIVDGGLPHSGERVRICCASCHERLGFGCNKVAVQHVFLSFVPYVAAHMMTAQWQHCARAASRMRAQKRLSGRRTVCSSARARCCVRRPFRAVFCLFFSCFMLATASLPALASALR